MRRWILGLVILGSISCEKGSVGDPCGDDSNWTAGGAGEADDIDGATITYPSGHSLNWKETDPAVLADELTLIGLINTHRETIGLKPLQFDRKLTHCARGHSHHHFEHSLFEGHVNPEGDDFVERMSKNGIDFNHSGENINYGAILPETVMQGWLDSPSHRANLERMCFGRIGVGKHQNVWTANFAR